MQTAIEVAHAAGVLGEVELWLLDNSLHDAYSAALQSLLTEVKSEGDSRGWHFLQLHNNAGFGAAHNRALLDSRTDYHLILNPDVDMASDSLLRALGAMEENTRIVALGPQARGADGRREYLCKGYPSLLVLLLRGFAPPRLRARFAHELHAYELRDRLAQPRLTEVPLLSGCFMLLRAAHARRIGGFDTSYFLYFEDYDLCMRLREVGSLVYAPQVSIVHYGGNAAAKGWRHRRWFLRSALRFFNSYGWRWR